MREFENKYELRLFQEWKQHGKIVIAVDFDDTIYPWKFRNADDMESFDRLVNLLQVAKATGAYITIFSACAPDRYEEIQNYCTKIKLPIDSINANPITLPYGNNGKVYANIYLDDRAGLLESIKMLETVMYHIRGERASRLTAGEGEE
jgi:hypothetical protein